MEIWKFDEAPETTKIIPSESNSNETIEIFGMYLVESDFCKTSKQTIFGRYFAIPQNYHFCWSMMIQNIQKVNKSVVRISFFNSSDF